MTKLFDNFSETKKENWIKGIEKELKGKPYESLIWTISQDIVVEPFYIAKDIDTLDAPLLSKKQDNNWQISETFDLLDKEKDNKQLLEALMNGVSAPILVLNNDFDINILPDFLLNVELDYIQTHFVYKTSSATKVLSLLKHFAAWATTNKVDTAHLEGSVRYEEDDYSQKNVAQLINWAATNLPKFKLFTLSNTEQSPEYQLSALIAQSEKLITTLSAQGVSKETIAQAIQFNVPIGKSYFVEIAKIRALKLLWLNLMDNLEIKATAYPTIQAYLDKNDFDENPNTNMIKSATMAMAAAQSGVDGLLVTPAGNEPEKMDFYRRIARNVQHLLKMESYLEKVQDPAAGSYYIETLTEKLAEKAWSLVA